MKKLVIIDSRIYNSEHDSIITKSLLPDVVPIRYDNNMTKEQLYTAIGDTSIISQIAFIYHYPGSNRLPFFYDTVQLPSDVPYRSKYNFYSDKVIEIIKELKEGRQDSLKNDKFIVDILSCNLNNITYANEVRTIENDLDINIRFSVDKTGNSYNNDTTNWIMESEMPPINIRDQYFTNNILNWNGILLSDISNDIKNTSIYSSFISWNESTKTFTVLIDFSYIQLNLYDKYISLGPNEIFEGNNKTITLDTSYYVNDWFGLFSIDPSVSETTIPIIQNLGILNGKLASYEGYFLKQNSLFFNIKNCYTTGDILSGFGAGGIVGQNAGINGTITNCYNTGIIGGGGGAGGICGDSCHCTITNCYSTGEILGIDAGGISGSFSNCIITNCYSSGVISGVTAGGIVGKYSTINCIITNCYSSGIISGNDAGGISGGYSNCTISLCYTIGHITGDGAGGISGGSAQEQNSIDKCYTTGTISGNWTGGIIGRMSNGIITNCYSTGDIISGYGAGGIAGLNAGCTIINCYSSGIIYGGTNSANGGIAGTRTVSYQIPTIYSSVSNGTPIMYRYLNGQYITIGVYNMDINKPNSTTLESINDMIYSQWDNTVWMSGPPVIINGISYNLPILIGFQPIPPIPPIPPEPNIVINFGIETRSCCQANICNPNPQSFNYDNTNVIINKGGAQLVVAVSEFYNAARTGQLRPNAPPIFKSYSQMMEWKQRQNRR
jgi:hypothetical protein